MKCPGQDSRKLTVSYRPCPECGELVEFFSDETRARCTKCRAVVLIEQVPNCVQWCEAARECIGAERYDAIMKELKDAVKQHHDDTEDKADY